MNKGCGLLLLLLLTGVADGQDVTKPKRFEVEEDLLKYPQQTPQQAMQSVAKVLDEGRLDYLLAHLIEPAYIDAKMADTKKLYQGPAKSVELVAFNQLVKELADHFQKDPMLVEELRRYAKEGTWELDKAKGKANAKLPEVLTRRVYFVEIKGRWYMQNQR